MEVKKQIELLEAEPYLPKSFNPYDNFLTQEIWKSKYRHNNEANIKATLERAVNGVYAKDISDTCWVHAGRLAVTRGLFMPAGRIIAGAGTEKRVTLMNCYVNAEIPDSMEGIADGLKNIMLTQQQGGGIGTDFSTLRPTGATLHRTGSYASGPLPFMDTWNAACSTIMSAGDRRGAMMGTISDTHPDLPKFITAKRESGRLTNFNLSVLVTDAFMEAVFEDEQWLLYFDVEPYGDRAPELIGLDFFDEFNNRQYVYNIWRAKELWALITNNTYEFSEPGVIFIDRINELNNLQYCETIRCTNPCGEQPLPPHGTCNLGAIGLPHIVKNPFTENARIDWDLLTAATHVGIRFLDNVIDVTNYPLEEQKQEEWAKRRVGLGISGLADMLAMMGVRYGSHDAARLYGEVQKHITLESYTASMRLAMERGSFPLFNKERFFQGFAGKMLPKDLQDMIYNNGIRNGVLNTIAPVGTTSIVFGDISSGIEPVFAREANRKVRQPDDTFKTYKTYNFSARLFKHMYSEEEYPRYMVEAADLKIYEHIAMQEAGQRWIDASVSKTINVPEETTYEDFVDVYKMAYEARLKGCTTYRPSAVRGSILSIEDPSATSTQAVRQAEPYRRPQVLQSITCKVKWPNLQSALYITLGYDDEGRPYEIFLNSKDQRFTEWMTTTTLMLSWLIRSGTPFETLCEELKQIHSMEGAFAEQQYRPSLVSFIGTKLLEMYRSLPGIKTSEPIETASATESRVERDSQNPVKGVACPTCKGYNTYREEGCLKCGDCGYSKCG